MQRPNRMLCFWHATDSNVPAWPIAHRAELMLPTDPLLAAARPIIISAYEHGQNAARRGKHVQACPFDTGTVEWRQWRDGFRNV